MLQARERVEQMKEEKKKQIEQKFAQIDEKTEKVRASGWWAVPWWAPSRSDSGAHGFWAPLPWAMGNKPGLQGQGVQSSGPILRG